MTSNLLKQFGTNTGAQEEGVWHSLGGGIQVNLRRINSKKANAVNDKYMEPLQAMYPEGDFPEDAQREVLLRQISEGLVADWKGIKDDEGKDLKFSPEVAYDLLSDPSLDDFNLKLLSLSSNMKHYKLAKEVKEAVEKN